MGDIKKIDQTVSFMPMEQEQLFEETITSETKRTFTAQQLDSEIAATQAALDKLLAKQKQIRELK